MGGSQLKESVWGILFDSDHCTGDHAASIASEFAVEGVALSQIVFAFVDHQRSADDRILSAEADLPIEQVQFRFRALAEPCTRRFHVP